MAATLFQLRLGVLSILNDVQDTTEVTAAGERYRTLSLNRFINNAVRFYVRYLNSFYQGYLSSIISINTVVGQVSYPLGATFRSPIYEVRRTINQVDYYLEEFTPYNSAISTIPIPNAQWLPAYWLEGMNIVFSSPPDSVEVGAVRVRFQGKLTDLAVDASILDDQLYDAEECIKMRAAIQALKAKDVSGALKAVGGWERELAENEKTFFMQIGNRYVKPDRPLAISSYSSDYYY